MSEDFAGRMGYDCPVDGGTRARWAGCRSIRRCHGSAGSAPGCATVGSRRTRGSTWRCDPRRGIGRPPALDLRWADADSERHAHAEGADARSDACADRAGPARRPIRRRSTCSGCSTDRADGRRRAGLRAAEDLVRQAAEPERSRFQLAVSVVTIGWGDEDRGEHVAGDA